MASGNKRIVVPSSQRVYSSDINRLQDVISADVVELLNYLMLASTNDDDDSGGRAAFQTTTINPLFGVIVNGLTFQPGIGSANANVSQGLLVCVDPDGSPSPDDSPVKYVRVPDSGILTLTPNSSGSQRIDVVEVQRANTVTETQTVDIFNTTTGLFSPQSVTKAVQSTLNYRIRLGANGGGFPGTNTGWMPVAVCSVPDGSSIWDTVSVWDVRPLVNDRVRPILNASTSLPGVMRSPFYLSTANTTGGTKLIMQGYLESQIGNSRVGGAFLDNGTADQINLQANTFLEPGTTFSTNQAFAVYLALPFGLPRWVAYTPSVTGQRRPRGPRGLPILSTKLPQTPAGRPSVALTLPSGAGLSGPPLLASQTVCVAFGFCTSIAGYPDNVVSDGRMQFCGSLGPAVLASNTSAGSVVNFSLTPGTDFPGNARRLRLKFTSQATWSNGYVAFSINTFDDQGGGGFQSTFYQTIASQNQDPSGGNTYTVTAEVPVQATFPSDLAPTPHKVALKYEGSVTGLSIGAANTHSVQVVGWDLGP